MRLGWRIAAIWSIAAFLSASQTVIGMHAEGMRHNWWLLFIVMAARWLPWAVATIWTLRLARNQWPAPGDRLRPIAIHFLNWLGITIAAATWSAWLSVYFQPFGREYPQGQFIPLMRGHWHSAAFLSIITYAAILAIGRGLDNWYTAAKLRADLNEAELRALRSQLEPHFLFNALHSIAGLVRDNRNQEAVSMIAGLSGLLRQVLDSQPQQLVPLREELDFARQYLEIQEMRFADRLRVDWNIDDQAKAVNVPHLILQPLLENAVQYGSGRIEVVARREGGVLHLSIDNDAEAVNLGRAGIGLSATRKRLATLYNGAAHFDVVHTGSGVSARLRIPCV